MRNFAFLLLLLNVICLAWRYDLFKALSFGEVELSSAQQVVGLPSGFVVSDFNPIVLLSEALPNLEGEVVEEVLGDSVEVGSVEGLEGALEEGESEIACVSIGAFENTQASDEAIFELMGLGYDANSVLVETINGLSYRLYLPPFESLSAARMRLQELQDANIDSFIIPEGELQQGISLGLFRERPRVLSLQADLLEKGFESDILEVVRSSNEIWVDVEGLLLSDIEAIREIELIKQQPELKLQEKLCETIAPEG